MVPPGVSGAAGPTSPSGSPLEDVAASLAEQYAASDWLVPPGQPNDWRFMLPVCRAVSRRRSPLAGATYVASVLAAGYAVCARCWYTASHVRPGPAAVPAIASAHAALCPCQVLLGWYNPVETLPARLRLAEALGRAFGLDDDAVEQVAGAGQQADGCGVEATGGHQAVVSGR